MQLGILGTGAMAAALAGAWVRAGHEVLVGGRDPHASADVAGAVGAAGGGLADAAKFGDAVLIALPAAAAPDVVGALAADLSGRTLLDCTVPMAPGPTGPLATTTGPADSVAVRLAAAAPESQVAKVFGVCHESIWTLPRPTFEGTPLAVPFCSGHPETESLVTDLVTSMHCRPIACGGLDRAGLLEAAAIFAIGVWWSGGEVRHAFPSPALAAGASDDSPLDFPQDGDSVVDGSGSTGS